MTTFGDRLKAVWDKLNAETIGTPFYWSIALQNLSVFEDMQPLIERFAHGRTLDVGAGRLAWRFLLDAGDRTYLSADVEADHPELDVVFDLTRPWPFPDGSFDTLFCFAVLEHAREPWLAFQEMHRVLVPGGVALISVPFLFYLHGLPNDYYRFTQYSVQWLASSAGFQVEELVTNGGLVHLVLNVPSVLLSCALASVGLNKPMRIATAVFRRMAQFMDSHFDGRHVFANNFMAALRKPVL